ncbi:aminopeptidase [Candidatus Woesearchaeota archaeon]|nr:aminopeptidase [Candidatus Woesearchaeota archaeon]
METIESINWLKENNLFESSKEAAAILKKIFTPCLAVQDERVLIMGDRGSKNKKIASILAGAYYLAADELKLDTKLVLQGLKSRGDQAEDDVTNSLFQLKEGDVVVVCMSDKLGSIGDLGKSFRKFCEKKKFKFVSALSLGDLETTKLNHVINAINIDYKPMQLQHEKIKQILDRGKEVYITTKAGTNLYYNIDGMTATSADGNYTTPGKGGNLPAGEVYIPCNGKNVNGKVIVDGSSRNHKHTAIIKEPITLEIEEGKVVEISGGEEAKLLERTLDWAASRAKNPGSVRRVGEFGIGLNPKAQIIGATIVDEKTLGTAHIGIGSNYWFGGGIYAIIHLDQIFKNPVIKIDGEELKP